MPEYLYTVDQAFEVPHQGIYLGPGLGPTFPGIRFGDRIELRKPDGSSTGTTIRSIGQFFMASPAEPCRYLILLPPGFEAGDIPIGTEVWTAS